MRLDDSNYIPRVKNSLSELQKPKEEEEEDEKSMDLDDDLRSTISNLKLDWYHRKSHVKTFVLAQISDGRRKTKHNSW